MEVIGKRSADPLYGFLAGILLLLVSALCSALLGMNTGGYFMVIPAAVAVIFIVTYGRTFFLTPYNLICYDAEKKTLTIYPDKHQTITFSLAELEKMNYAASGIRRKYTGNIYFQYGENKFCSARNVADAKNVAEKIAELRKTAEEAQDEKLSYFEKL